GFIQNHDGVRAGRYVDIEALLHPRIARQLKVSILRGVNCLVGTPDHPAGLAAFASWLVSHHPYVALDNGPVESLALFAAEIDRQLVSLDLETRISHDNVPGKHTRRFGRIE